MLNIEYKQHGIDKAFHVFVTMLFCKSLYSGKVSTVMRPTSLRIALNIKKYFYYGSLNANNDYQFVFTVCTIQNQNEWDYYPIPSFLLFQETKPLLREIF